MQVIYIGAPFRTVAVELSSKNIPQSITSYPLKQNKASKFQDNQQLLIHEYSKGRKVKA